MVGYKKYIMTKGILIQSRLSSSRYPKKMLMEFNGVPLIEYVYKRCTHSINADKVVVITSNEASDDDLYEFCLKKNMNVFRGDLENVLQRYIDAASYLKVDLICRVCGDSPFVDIDAIDQMFQLYDKEDIEYQNYDTPINGFMSEVFPLSLLQKINEEALSKLDQEHVTKYIRENSAFNKKILKFDIENFKNSKELPPLTVDYPSDKKVVEKVMTSLKGYDFTSLEVIQILEKLRQTNEL